MMLEVVQPFSDGLDCLELSSGIVKPDVGTLNGSRNDVLPWCTLRVLGHCRLRVLKRCLVKFVRLDDVLLWMGDGRRLGTLFFVASISTLAHAKKSSVRPPCPHPR